MGGGPEKEHMVIALWGPEPADRIAELRSRFPYIEVTYVDLGEPGAQDSQDGTDSSERKQHSPKSAAVDAKIPAELYAKATIWVCLGVLPPTASSAPNLRLIHLFSAGVDRYAEHWIVRDSDVPLTTSSGISGPPIAEWVLLMSLVGSVGFPALWERQQAHLWTRGGELGQRRDWVGKKVGVAGYGSIGRQVARLFAALGGEVVAYTAGPRETPESHADRGYIVPGTGDALGTVPKAWFSGTRKADLHEFLRQGLDLLVICLPLTESTERSIGKWEFDILASECTTPGGPYVANISRGRIIDQPALVDALNGGVLAGAMLDVADPEPLPKDDPLWEAKNVLITPHMSGSGVEYMDRAYDVLMTNLARREKGEKMFNLVDRRKGY